MRTMLLGDIGNRLDIADTEEDLARLRREAKADASRRRKSELTVQMLRDELERQRLAVTALTRFLIEKEVVSEEELQFFIEAVDGEDGVVDGKLAIEKVGVRPRLVRKATSPGEFKKM